MDSATPATVTLDDVDAAARRLDGVLRRTPTIRIALDDGRPLTLKLEQLQVTGSFKARGATNAIRALPADTPGVVTASGGNHGQAVAWAAANAGIDAVVVVPTTSPDLKADRVASFGARVVRHGDVYDDAEALARRIQADEGRTFVHAFGDPMVVAGQGTVGREMLAQAPDCDALVAGIGGGGLVSGVGVAASTSAVRVIGAEPVGAPTLYEAVAAGGVPVEVTVDTITRPSLGARVTTALNARLVADHVDRIVLIDDAAVLAARDWLWDRVRIAAELGGCIGLAAVLTGNVDADHPCVLICGANDDWAAPTFR